MPLFHVACALSLDAGQLVFIRSMEAGQYGIKTSSTTTDYNLGLNMMVLQLYLCTGHLPMAICTGLFLSIISFLFICNYSCCCTLQIWPFTFSSYFRRKVQYHVVSHLRHVLSREPVDAKTTLWSFRKNLTSQGT